MCFREYVRQWLKQPFFRNYSYQNVCSVLISNLTLKGNPIHISIFHFSTPCMNTPNIPFLIKTAACLNVNHPDIQKDTTTYITISNDVLNFTISRLTICRNSIVKYKFKPLETLENAFFSAFYFSKLFIVGNNSTSLIAGLFVIIITILSIPNPIPPVGGIPILSAFRKSSSV